MRLLAALVFFAASTLPGVASAGDPCPIDFIFHDLGAPHWLDRDALLDGLESKDSWVGISFSDTQGGVKIDAVSAGSPAAKAGLAKGMVIVEAGGMPMTRHQDLAAGFRATDPGGQVQLKLADGKTINMTLGRQDPVIGALLDYAHKQDCAYVRRGAVTQQFAEATRPKLFSKQRRFRCDDAHQALAKDHEPGQIMVVRGSRRMLLSNPGWATVCIRSKSADGGKLTEKRIGEIFRQLTKAYVKDRHDNP